MDQLVQMDAKFIHICQECPKLTSVSLSSTYP